MIRKYALTAFCIVVHLVGSLVGGWYITCIFTLLPMEMPLSVERSIRFALSTTGNNDLSNPDDMEMPALVLYWAIATLLTAVVLIGFKRWISRLIIARKSAEAIPKLPWPVTLAASLLALVVISFLGWQLASPLTRYPLHIPGPVKAVVRFYLSATGQGARSDLDENLILYVMDLYWAIATLCIGAPVVLCCLAIRRFMRRKINLA
ncbi:hypothetical protein [Paraburkholderia xenovorans]